MSLVDYSTARQGQPALRRDRAAACSGLWLAWTVLALAFVAAVAPQLFTHYSPTEGIAGAQRCAAQCALARHRSTRTRPAGAHRLWRLAVALCGGRGGGDGAHWRNRAGRLAGTVGGRTEQALMRLVDVLLSIPALLLSLSLLILLGFGTVHAALAVGIASIASFARLARGEVVRVRRSEYVEAAFGSGGRFWQVLWRHIVPNSLTAVIAFAALQFGQAILALSTLSFLGYGTPPPTPNGVC